MKKLGAALLAAMILLPGNPVFGDGINFNPGNGDMVSIMKDVRIEDKTSGSVVVILGNLDISGEIAGDVVVVLGDLSVNSKINGDTVNVLGDMQLGSRAVIEGDVVSIGGFDKAAGALVRGDEVKIQGFGFDPGIELIFFVRSLSLIFFTFATLVLGLILLFLFKNRYEDMLAGMDQDTGKKLVLGFLGFIAATIVMVILFITLVIPLAYFALLLMASAVASMYFGRVILRSFNINASIYVEFISGLALIALLKAGLLYLIPMRDFITANVLVLILGIFINSLGIGILLKPILSKRT